MASVELAVALPAIILVLVLGLSAIQWGMAQVRCIDAARVGVRELARGDPTGTALAQARRAAPDGSEVTARRSGTEAVVTVRSPPVPGLSWVGISAAPSARASAVVELLPEAGP